jgi:uncharacterized membrane protein YvbJ
MVFCSKCGAENDEESQYCGNCDKELKMELNEEFKKAAIEQKKMIEGHKKMPLFFLFYIGVIIFLILLMIS